MRTVMNTNTASYLILISGVVANGERKNKMSYRGILSHVRETHNKLTDYIYDEEDEKFFFGFHAALHRHSLDENHTHIWIKPT